MNVPEADGVPLIEIVLEFQAAVTPAGNPVGVPMPVAPVVVWVMGVSAVFIQRVGVAEGVLAVILSFTTNAPETSLEAVPQSPVTTQ